MMNHILLSDVRVHNLFVGDCVFWVRKLFRYDLLRLFPQGSQTLLELLNHVWKSLLFVRNDFFEGFLLFLDFIFEEPDFDSILLKSIVKVLDVFFFDLSNNSFKAFFKIFDNIIDH